MSGPARRRRPAIRGNGEIPTSLRDLIKYVQTGPARGVWGLLHSESALSKEGSKEGSSGRSAGRTAPCEPPARAEACSRERRGRRIVFAGAPSRAAARASPPGRRLPTLTRQ